VTARDDVAALVLAGGRGRRMGGAVKPLLTVEGRTILDRLIEALTPVCAEILVSVAAPGQLTTDLRCVVDEDPGAGPLAGIAAGLAAAGRRWLVVVGGDMPDVRTEVVASLLARAAPGVDAVAARIGGFPEPLCAVYGASCLDASRRRLREGRFRTGGLLTDEELAVVWVEEHDLRRIDPDLRSFRSINRPEDLARS
jgi:molybdopterin-guanine dinucleotide biosynthesis protein A